MSRICFAILLIICILLIKKLYHSTLQVANSASNRIIVVNLRAINQTIPEFIAEDEDNRVLLKAQQQPQYMLEEDGGGKADQDQEPEHHYVEPAAAHPQPHHHRPPEEAPVYSYEAMIKADEDQIVPGLGDYGDPVKVVPYATEEEIEKCMKKEAFNKILSDKISFTRKVPDARHPLCITRSYEENLPTASIIIIFINEAWSSLMRTIHSALIRTPDKLLKEIILVDDSSDREDLKGKLDYYIRTRLPDKVKLVRLAKRNGLIKARLAGAQIATGDVLVFLDSHCECGIDWIQPLVQRVKEQKNAVVCPVIDVIDDRTMGYMFNYDRQFQIGGFTWSGHFTWIPIPEYEQRRRETDADPTRSPTMAGGLFAIDRNYFWEIGSYDSKMEVWGGENLEMSFRIWQCGGSLEIIPCSRVGHIFRSFHPYTFPGKKDTHGINTARMVEVWMDEYKRLFYLHRPDLKKAKLGDLSTRKELRDKLHCHDFAWYLKNVIPQKFILDENVQAYGRVRSKVRNFCFDNLNFGEDTPHNLGLYNCHPKLFTSQYFSLTLTGELRREELCAEVQQKTGRLAENSKGNVTLTRCDGNSKQIWSYENEMIRHVDTNLCIHSYGATPESPATVAECKANDVYFRWIWEYLKQPDSNNYYRNHLFR